MNALPTGGRGPAVGSPGRALVVVAKRPVDGRTVEVVLARDDGGPLPRWAPGAHIDLVLPGGLVRPYSLCGDPDDRTSWRLLVRRRPPGQDGKSTSGHVHDELRVGDTVHVRGPRDLFGLATDPRHLFLGAGAGIAPLLPMARRVRSARIYPWSLRHLERQAEPSRLVAEVDSLGPDARTVTDIADIEAAIAAAPPGTAVYACGSDRFVAAVRELVPAGAGLALHCQRFAHVRPAAGDLPGCELVLARRGDRVPVPPGTSVLEALRDAGVDVPLSCGSDVCGACVIPVLDGRVRHRDAVLTDEERAAGRWIVTCVSGGDSPTLVLDL
ncbi:PDR/VanB family oxidoreductase [Spirillospora sp. NPDC052242]